MSRDELHAYWRDHHGPRVIATADFMRYVRKYTRNYLFEDQVFPTGGRWDAMVEPGGPTQEPDRGMPGLRGDVSGGTR